MMKKSSRNLISFQIEELCWTLSNRWYNKNVYEMTDSQKQPVWQQ